MCKMTPISVRLNLRNFILISCAVLELLRKVTWGGGIRPPPGEIGLTVQSITGVKMRFHVNSSVSENEILCLL